MHAHPERSKARASESLTEGRRGGTPSKRKRGRQRSTAPAAGGEPTTVTDGGRPTSQCINWGDPPPTDGKDDGLLRKEVIQPHLPVRLPCYDFTPIADPTFDSSLPKG